MTPNIWKVALLAALTSGCSEEFNDCVDEWHECKEGCPEDLDEAQRQCISQCQPLPNGGACIKACIAAKAACVACDEEFAECVGDIGVCGDPASLTYLRQVSIPNWCPHLADVLSNANHPVAACSTHFPAGSPERAELESAIDDFNGLSGSTINMSVQYQAHKTKSALFVDPPTISTFEYVDNANDAFIHACHPDNTTACSDQADAGINGFAINTCRYGTGDWKGGGNTDFFSITANANCYSYFTNSSSTDYVKKTGATHELGHAAGMNHTDSWPVADQQYISTMQGNLEYLSAYDVAFLRQHYPVVPMVPQRNFVASSKVRFDFGGPNQVSGTFDAVNPDRIYLVGNRVFDCDTKAEATWYTAWFNTGHTDQEPDHCMVNELRIEESGTGREAILKQLHAATMPNQSQDQWKGLAQAEAADFTGLPFGMPLDLVFEVNVYEQWREISSDNEVRKLVTLYSSSACTAPFPLPMAALPAIRQLAANTYDLDRAFVARLISEPERVLRGAALAPAHVGAGPGLGFKFFMVEPDSLPWMVGARTGDILWRVEGNAITSTTLASAIQILNTTGQVRLGVVRNQAMREVKLKLR
jgi:hypothetical protein